MNLYQFTVDRVTASGKLNVYLTGTTTTATFYTDPAGTTAGTSPMTADGAGQFAPIYLDPSITYRIKVTNNAGSTTYYDIDPVRLTDEGTADGVLMVRSVDDAKKRKIPANVSAVYCAGFADKDDRGQAQYVRVASASTTDGNFTSADGAVWELSENVLNPFMFGAKGDGTTDDSAAIQAMFGFIEDKDTPYPVNFMGAEFFVHTGITLPRIAPNLALDINGGGATLTTDQAITILGNTLPTSQSNAGTVIGQCTYEIHDFMFEGTNAAGQVGLHLMACYTPVVRNCFFSALDYGSIGTFCLASAWRDNRYFSCAVRGAMLQSAVAYDAGTTLWSGATLSNSPCNVSVFENCRVYGHADQISAFGIFASDAVRMNGCISEGEGANYDVHFDYHGSTTTKNFWINTLHCEAHSVLNLKLRAAGKVFIENLVRSLPAAICDAKGSTNCEINFKGISYLGNMPTATGSGSNPNGRWFYHSDGGGYGGTESGHSSGVGFRFEDCVEDAYLQFNNTAHWENATLPYMLHVRGLLSANNGVQEWSSSLITFGTPIWLSDGSSLAGVTTGTVTSATTSVAANSSVTESFSVSGLKLFKHTVFVNPYNSAYVPPAGIVWNAWIETDNAFKIRYTNVTGSAITLATSAVWRFCAPKQN